MTPEELQQRLGILEAFMQALMRSDAIPRDVQTAFAERFNDTYPFVSGTGTPNTQSSFSGFPVLVPANPSGTLKITYKGQTYEVLLK